MFVLCYIDTIFLSIGVPALILLFLIPFIISKSGWEKRFVYPYCDVHIDVSGRRKVNLEDCVDTYLIENGMDEIEEGIKQIELWKLESVDRIENKKFFRESARREFEECLDDAHQVRFIFERTYTKTYTVAYTPQSYRAKVESDRLEVDIFWVRERFARLREIGFSSTLNMRHSAIQRRLMTKQLRDEIARRDDYTCRICGKYMPDGIGLVIDHVIPVSRGGTSVPANLQVLCSKCNGFKSAKLYGDPDADPKRYD